MTNDEIYQATASAVDKAIAHTRTLTTLSCAGTGCSGCCRGEVLVPAWEWALVRAAIPAATWTRLRAARAEPRPDPETGRCLLLHPTRKTCDIYSRRPSICRAYVAVTPVEWCSPELSGIQQVATPDIPMLALIQAWATYAGEVPTQGKTLLDWIWDALSEDEIAASSGTSLPVPATQTRSDPAPG